MEEKNFYILISKGVFRALIITIVMLIVLAVLMSTMSVESSVVSVYFLVATCASIMYGSIYSARKNNEKGWLVGIVVAILYMLVLYLISAIVFKDLGLDVKNLIRFTIALAVGALSGMLGINL